MTHTITKQREPIRRAGFPSVWFTTVPPDLARCPATPVLLLGRGALRAARELHRRTYAARPGSPFVVVDCCWLPNGQAGRLLFGNEATRGYVDRANGGTLMLDNVEYLPSPEQAAIADLVDCMAFRRPGGHEQVTVSLRVVAAVRTSSEELMDTSRLIPALGRRLDVVVVRLA